VSAISLSPPQTLPSLGVPSLTSIEEAVPVYYEEDSDEDDEIDSSLLNDYVLFELEHGAPAFSDSEELVEVPVITMVRSSSSPPPSSLVEVREGERHIVNSFTEYISLDVISLSPSQVPVTAWWEGWKSSSNLISDDYTPMEEVSSLPSLQLTVAAWWEGWKSPPTTFH